MTDYLCNLLIPGAAKSGTSSLHASLASHPNICMSTPKEPQFFSFDDRFEGGAVAHNKIFSERSLAHTYFGESSQCYFSHEWALERISRVLTNPKIILLLRHPVDRALSHYKWNYRRGFETDALLCALINRGYNNNYYYVSDLDIYDSIGGYIAFSQYTKWVYPWINEFGQENVLILKFEEFISDHEYILNRCFSFLGIPVVNVEFIKRNSTSNTFRKNIPDLLKGISGRIPKELKNYAVYKGAKNQIRRFLTTEPPTVSEDALKLLKRELADDIRFFEGLK